MVIVTAIGIGRIIFHLSVSLPSFLTLFLFSDSSLIRGCVVFVARNRFHKSGNQEPLEVKETKECVIYRIDMPGCPTSDLVYWVHGNELQVFAEEPAMPEYNHSGRKYGGSLLFETEFYDVKRARVDLLNGVLWIIVPKVKVPGKIIKANVTGKMNVIKIARNDCV